MTLTKEKRAALNAQMHIAEMRQAQRILAQPAARKLKRGVFQDPASARDRKRRRKGDLLRKAIAQDESTLQQAQRRVRREWAAASCGASALGSLLHPQSTPPMSKKQFGGCKTTYTTLTLDLEMTAGIGKIRMF